MGGAAATLRRPFGGIRYTLRDWIVLTIACAGAAFLGIALVVRVESPDVAAVIGLAVGVPSVAYLALSRRYGVTIAIFGLYLGLLDGFLKLKTGVQMLSLGRNVLMAAIVGGALIRLMMERERPKLPPLSGWIIALTVITLAQVFNPFTIGAMKAFLGVRQQLEWIPLFFFAYLLLRDKTALRNLAIIVGVIATVNAAVSLVQYQLTPEALAAWGPGFAERINGTGDVAARVFVDNAGNARVRPFALGSDMGFAGVIGVIAAPLVLALLATGDLAKRSLLGGVLAAAVLVGILTSQSRSALIGAVVVIIAFAAMGFAGARVWRSLLALALVGTVMYMVVPILTSSAASGSFDRYSSISPGKVFGTAYEYRQDDVGGLTHLITNFPLGQGLGWTGPARAFGTGPLPWELHAEVFNGETNFNFLVIELGVPGMLLLPAMMVWIIFLAFTRLSGIADPDVRTYVAGALAPNVQTLFGGLGGPTMSAPPFAPWFWLSAGIAAYWLVGPGQEVARARLTLKRPTADPQTPVTPAPPPTPALARRTVPEPSRAPARATWDAAPPAVAAEVASDVTISVCVIVRDDADAVGRALAGIRPWRTALREVIVCDDRTRPPDPASRLTGAIWLEGPHREIGDARGAALRAATGTHVLFLDADAELGPGFLTAVRASLAKQPRARRRSTIVAGVELRSGRASQEQLAPNATLFPRALLTRLGAGLDDTTLRNLPGRDGTVLVRSLRAVNVAAGTQGERSVLADARMLAPMASSGSTSGGSSRRLRLGRSSDRKRS